MFFKRPRTIGHAVADKLRDDPDGWDLRTGMGSPFFPWETEFSHSGCGLSFRLDRGNYISGPRILFDAAHLTRSEERRIMKMADRLLDRKREAKRKAALDRLTQACS